MAKLLSSMSTTDGSPSHRQRFPGSTVAATSMRCFIPRKHIATKTLLLCSGLSVSIGGRATAVESNTEARSC